ASESLMQSTLPTRLPSECRNDLLSIDGVPVSIRLEATVSDALSGRPLGVALCEGATLVLPDGAHRLRAASGLITGWDIDTVTLRSVDRRPVEPASSLDFTSDRSRRTIEVPSCSSRCWIEFPDGWNGGWRSGDSTLGVALASAAGRNTWLLDADQTPSTVTVTWAPQRILWWGLALTGITMLLLLAVAVADSSGRLRRVAERRVVRDPVRFRGVGLPLTALLLGALLIAPLWGVALSVVGLTLARRPKLFAAAGWTMVGLSMAFLVAQQLRTGAEPGFGWPSVFVRAHRPALMGIVAMWCAVRALDDPRTDPR
ncbi:MAG: hypothetical protein ACO3SP_09910, partial [Ilumatobacteraceae bacterium]